MARLNSTQAFYFYYYFYAAAGAQGRIVTPDD
jgi:hypothetical protein